MKIVAGIEEGIQIGRPIQLDRHRGNSAAEVGSNHKTMAFVWRRYLRVVKSHLCGIEIDVDDYTREQRKANQTVGSFPAKIQFLVLDSDEILQHRAVAEGKTVDIDIIASSVAIERANRERRRASLKPCARRELLREENTFRAGIEDKTPLMTVNACQDENALRKVCLLFHFDRKRFGRCESPGCFLRRRPEVVVAKRRVGEGLFAVSIFRLWVVPRRDQPLSGGHFVVSVDLNRSGAIAGINDGTCVRPGLRGDR